MFEVKKLGEDVWVAMEGEVEVEKGDYISEHHVPDEFEYIQEDDYSDEEWDKLEEKMEADAISWWV